jgi:hypothetical protein
LGDEFGADSSTNEVPIAPFTLLCASDLADTAVFYFKKFFFPVAKPDGLLMTVVAFIEDSPELGLPTDPLVGSDWTRYWTYLGSRLPKLAKLAMRILSVVCQSASCERLFKDFAMIHTKSRNRMDKATTEAIELVKHQLMIKKKTVTAALPMAKSKRRIVQPQERRRLDLVSFDVATAVKAKGIPDELDDLDLADTEDAVLENGGDTIAFWSEILDLLGSDDMAATSMVGAADLVRPQASVTSRCRPSLSPASLPANLAPLPATNIASYPQYTLSEDATVRSAKVTLSALFDNAVVLPALF